MQAQPEFGFQDLFNHVIGNMARALCERAGEGKQSQFLRSQATVHTIMSFMPRDAIEAMLAGQCVMLHDLVTDTVHETLRGELETTRRATRAGIVAMNKAFHMNLAKLEGYQKRLADGRRDAPAQQATMPGAEARPAQAQAEDGLAIQPRTDPLQPAAAQTDMPQTDMPQTDMSRTDPFPEATSEDDASPPDRPEAEVPAAQTAPPETSGRPAPKPRPRPFGAPLPAAMTSDWPANPPSLEELAAQILPLERRLATYLERATAAKAASAAPALATAES